MIQPLKDKIQISLISGSRFNLSKFKEILLSAEADGADEIEIEQVIDDTWGEIWVRFNRITTDEERKQHEIKQLKERLKLLEK